MVGSGKEHDHMSSLFEEPSRPKPEPYRPTARQREVAAIARQRADDRQRLYIAAQDTARTAALDPENAEKRDARDVADLEYRTWLAAQPSQRSISRISGRQRGRNW